MKYCRVAELSLKRGIICFPAWVLYKIHFLRPCIKLGLFSSHVEPLAFVIKVTPSVFIRIIRHGTRKHSQHPTSSPLIMHVKTRKVLKFALHQSSYQLWLYQGFPALKISRGTLCFMKYWVPFVNSWYKSKFVDFMDKSGDLAGMNWLILYCNGKLIPHCF